MKRYVIAQSLLDSLFEETLAEFPKVFDHDTLDMLGGGGVDTFAEDLGRSMPLLDDGVDESLLNNKWVMPWQLTSACTGIKCKDQLKSHNID